MGQLLRAREHEQPLVIGGIGEVLGHPLRQSAATRWAVERADQLLREPASEPLPILSQ